MHITLIDTKLDLQNGGGSNIDLHSTACGLVEHGHDVQVLTVVPSRNRLPESLPYAVVEVPLSDRPLGLRGKLALVSVLRRMEADTDVFQIEAPSLFISGALYRRFGGAVPVIAHLMNYGYFCTSPDRMTATCFEQCTLLDQVRHRQGAFPKKSLGAPLRVVEHYVGRRVINRVDRFLALTGPAGDVYVRHGIDPARISYLPCKIDFDGLSVRSRPEAWYASAGESPFRIIYVGRLVPAKGVDVLLRAVAGLDIPFVLDIVGDGASRGALEALAAELGITEQVIFHGWQPHETTTEYYLQAHVMVHPGRWPEPQGITVLEAAALGVPVIISDVGGPTWTLRDAALRFTPDDHLDLRAKLIELHGNSETALRISRAGRTRARLYDRTEVLRSLLAVYDDVTSGRIDAHAQIATT
jgi:glycosyltransferase involved in cell wall biosynthesis